jgi:hypothetical protein
MCLMECNTHGIILRLWCETQLISVSATSIFYYEVMPTFFLKSRTFLVVWGMGIRDSSLAPGIHMLMLL